MKIESLSKDELTEIARDARMTAWDLRIAFVRLFQTYTEFTKDANISAHEEFIALCKYVSWLMDYLAGDREISKFFTAKWQKLEPLLSDKDLELRPTKKVLESWAQALAYIFDTEPVYRDLLKTLIKIQLENPSSETDKLFHSCLNFTKKLRESRLQVFKIARLLGDHDNSKGNDTIAELKALGEEQLQLFRKTQVRR
ncbi:MAG: hypothetical protein LUC43_00750 [Burkholderiales bacterium]|nr:hypothetical protein [Burkholderiales bacterium]